MKTSIPLTLALTATMTLGTAFAEDTKSINDQNTEVESSKNSPIAQGEGKCASGKCGSLKKFGVVDMNQDEQDGKLVRVRDGNCGSHNCKVYKEGKKEVRQLGKCSNGVCGK